MRKLDGGRAARSRNFAAGLAISAAAVITGAAVAALFDSPTGAGLRQRVGSLIRRLLDHHGRPPQSPVIPPGGHSNRRNPHHATPSPEPVNHSPPSAAMPLGVPNHRLQPLTDVVPDSSRQPRSLKYDSRPENLANSEPWKPRAATASVWHVAKETITQWLNAKPFRLAGALAYYTVFSMAPLLVVALGIAGLVFGEQAARGEIFGPIQTMLGPKSADTVQNAVAAASVKSSGVLATVLGVVSLLIGASAVFGELQDALNTIWEAKPPPNAGIWGLVKNRLLSIAMVAVIGFLLLVSLILSSVLNAIGAHLGGAVPVPAFGMEAVNFVVSFAVVTLLFASMFKFLPDVSIAWSDVWIGAAVTAALFTVGKSLIGMYIGRMALDSTYGASASLVVVLVWMYYSSLIVYLGAEFTHVYARRRGSHIGAAPGFQDPARSGA